MKRVAILTIWLLVLHSTVSARAERNAPPYPQALDAAAIGVDRLDSIVNYGLLIGNGDVNALIYSEGGDLKLMLTKNDVWDARLDSKLDPPLPTLKLIKSLAAQGPTIYGNRSIILEKGSTWKGPDSYHAHPYPCPRACGRLVLGNRPGPARLDIGRAVARVTNSVSDEPRAEIRALAGRNVFLINSQSAAELQPVRSADIPQNTSGSHQDVAWLAQEIPGDPDWPGMNFAVALASRGDLKAVAIVTSRESDDPQAAAVELARSTLQDDTAELVQSHEAIWTKFWSASGIDIDDPVLRDIWYRNLYFLRCVSKPGSISPGLFASLINDSPAWHGDYHTNYNIQATFWGAFASNHTELTEPYDRLITEYLPRARWLAKKIFSMNGAYFPHVLFAYEPPHPEKCKSPVGRQYFHHVWAFTLGVNGFTVQPLWWHYKYEPDREFLDKVAYPAVRDVAVFQADFIDQCEGDKTVVLAPSISPEHWGWTKNFQRNRNGTFDIAMFRYIFAAAIEGATTLGRDAELVSRWKKAMLRLPPYPTTADDEPVVVDMQDAPPINYNIAVPATPVFPIDVVTWWSPAAEKDLFKRSIDRLKWNGNNSAVMLSIARARMSMPGTMEWVRDALSSRSRPNGAVTMNRLDPPARFNDFGHYTENFSATMCVSELLLQSVGDVIRVFPAWPADRDAQFRDLRTQGGFLVSARHEDGKTTALTVTSTVGGPLRLLSPWPAVRVVRPGSGQPAALTPDKQGIVRLDTRPGEQFVFEPGR